MWSSILRVILVSAKTNTRSLGSQIGRFARAGCTEMLVHAHTCCTCLVAVLICKEAYERWRGCASAQVHGCVSAANGRFLHRERNEPLSAAVSPRRGYKQPHPADGPGEETVAAPAKPPVESSYGAAPALREQTKSPRGEAKRGPRERGSREAGGWVTSFSKPILQTLALTDVWTNNLPWDPPLSSACATRQVSGETGEWG